MATGRRATATASATRPGACGEGAAMHGLAAVGAMVDAVVASLARQQPCRVEVVRVRRGSTLSEEALRRWFELLAVGTMLQGARLEIEAISRFVECACGRAWTAAPDELLWHRW